MNTTEPGGVTDALYIAALEVARKVAVRTDKERDAMTALDRALEAERARRSDAARSTAQQADGGEKPWERFDDDLEQHSAPVTDPEELHRIGEALKHDPPANAGAEPEESLSFDEWWSKAYWDQVVDKEIVDLRLVAMCGWLGAKLSSRPAAAVAGGVSDAMVDDLFRAIEHGDAEHRAWLKSKLTEFFAERARAPQGVDDISSPRPTDCADIREGLVTVLARDQDGNAAMTAVKLAPR